MTRPAGRLALYHIAAGADSASLIYPMPWAFGPVNSHLVASDKLRRAVDAAGWREDSVHDETRAARDWLTGAKPPGDTGGPTLRDVMGVDFPQMVANLRANFEAGRLTAIQAVFEKHS